MIVIDRFAPLRAHLLTLLAELGEDDWTRPAEAPRWSDIWILSGKRDGFRSNAEINSHSDPKFTLPIGVVAEIDCDTRQIRLAGPATIW